MISIITKGMISPIKEGNIIIQSLKYPLSLSLTNKKIELKLTKKSKIAIVCKKRN